ncbi:hypothetical protein GCM10010387_49500 [Streptomyces inusitatus]|uniref:Uncharacterized protein n=2 Tax=Streptomyces inusitatus TaxID=68221 RepID=A0A918QI17_9ACTN|nr:hypothetical protein GCM10010387_49500 [Streptomyces inusitatus]
MTALAGQVHPAPDAYHTARVHWRRRERRRRLVLTLLVAAVFTLAVLTGLWVLNSAPTGSATIPEPDHPPAATAPPRG